jgi:hypothetical protein
VVRTPISSRQPRRVRELHTAGPALTAFGSADRARANDVGTEPVSRSADSIDCCCRHPSARSASHPLEHLGRRHSGNPAHPCVTYHGGFSHLPDESRAGRLVLNDETLTLDQIVHETLTRNFDPPMELCRTAAVVSIEVTSEQVARSKVGAALLIGVLGAVTAKAASDRATSLVTLKSGETGYLTVNNQSAASLLGSLNPLAPRARDRDWVLG